jgi:hypothetical protein
LFTNQQVGFFGKFGFPNHEPLFKTAIPDVRTIHFTLVFPLFFDNFSELCFLSEILAA